MSSSSDMISSSLVHARSMDFLARFVPTEKADVLFDFRRDPDIINRLDAFEKLTIQLGDCVRW